MRLDRPWFVGATIALFIGLLGALFTPRFYQNAFAVGAGLSYSTLKGSPSFNLNTEAGRQQLRSVTESEGTKRAILMTAGGPVSVTCLIMIIVGLLTPKISNRFRRFLKISFWIITVGAVASLGIGYTVANPFASSHIESLFDSAIFYALFLGLLGLIYKIGKWLLSRSQRHESLLLTKPAIIATSKEVIGFRFLLMAWSIGILALLISGASYVMAEAKQSRLSAVTEANQACLSKVMPTIPDCNVPYDKGDGTCTDVAMARCHYGQQIDELIADRDNCRERTENSLDVALLLLIPPTLLFYGIRWGFTGRVRPLWLLNR